MSKVCKKEKDRPAPTEAICTKKYFYQLKHIRKIHKRQGVNMIFDSS
jgi:hypothetical protein